MSWSRRQLLTALAATPWLGCAGGTERRPPHTPEDVEVRLPEIDRGTLDTGPALYLMEDHQLPLVAMAVAVEAGHGGERPGEEGLAAVAAALLLEGMAGLDRAALLDRYGELGTTPFAAVEVRHLVLGCVVHRDDAPAAVRLMLDHLRAPLATEEAFVRVRRERRESLLAARGLPDVVAGLGLLRGTFGVDPPISLLGDGTTASLDALAPQSAWSWLPRRLGRDGLTFLFAGDVTVPQASAWIGAATLDGPASATAPGPMHAPALTPAPTPGRSPRVVLVPWASLPQAVVALGGRRAPLGHPDEPAEALASSVMSGLMHHELRERQRVSYGVQTRAWTTKRGPAGQIWAKVEPADTGRAVRQLWAFVDRLAGAQALSDGMVDDLRRANRVAMMHAHHGAEAGLAQLLQLAEGDLPARASARRLEQLDRLRASDVTEALRRLVQPDDVVMCVVGPPAALEAARRARPEAEVIQRSPDALFGAAAG